MTRPARCRSTTSPTCSTRSAGLSASPSANCSCPRRASSAASSSSASNSSNSNRRLRRRPDSSFCRNVLKRGAMTPVQPVRGTQSLLGEDADRLATVVAAFDRVRRLFGFKRVEVPTIEPTQVFARTIGETTDVVSKEMYSFDDRGGESITLRPEFTAGICRAYLSEGWQQYAPLKVATHGSAFRYERPQKGRFREFHQLDAEIIGVAEPQADVEILSRGYQLLRELGIPDGVTLELNTLGDPQTREAWRGALIDYFRSHKGALSEDSIARLERNPMRILDSKDPRDKVLAA